MPSNSFSCADYVVKETATLNWTINNFRTLTGFVKSKEFSLPNSTNIFELYLNSKTKFIHSEDVCTTLAYKENDRELPVQYRVSIVNSNGEKQFTQEYHWKFNKTGANFRYRNVNFTNFIGYNSGIRYSINGNLMLNCEVDVLERGQVAPSIVNVQASSTESNDQTNIQTDYQALLDNSKFSDASLLVKGKEFKVHKAILAARSKVFEAMFSADLEEKKQNRVEITDVEVDVFEHLLRYIYTGKISGLDEYGLELFVAADKYQLDHLKSVCEQYLCSHLTTESVINVLVIADMHNANELKSSCYAFINANSSAVIVTDQWKQMKSRSDLLMQLFEEQSNNVATKKQRTN